MFIDQTQKIHVSEGRPGTLNVSLEQAVGPIFVHVFLANWLDAAASDREAAARVELQQVLGTIDCQSAAIEVEENDSGGLGITLQQHAGFDYFSVVTSIAAPGEGDRETAARAEFKRLLLVILEDLATTRSRADLEDMARDAVRGLAGCAHVVDVELRSELTNAERPNWRLVGTTPPLPAEALNEATSMVEKLAKHYLMVDR